MADGSPQCEDGYTRIANELLEQIIKFDFSKRETKLIFAIIRQTYGWRKKSDRISLSQFESLTGVFKNHVSLTLRSLIERKIVLKQCKEYSINKAYGDWVTIKTRNENSTETVPKYRNSTSTKTVLKNSTVLVAPSTKTVLKNSTVLVTTKEKKETITKEKKETRETETSSEVTDSVLSEIKIVFKYWQTELNHPRSVLDKNRKTKIERAIKNYGVDDCLSAIRGCSKTPWNMGSNPGGILYDDCELIFRNAANIEKFIRADKHQSYKTEKDKINDWIGGNQSGGDFIEGEFYAK